MSIGMAECKCVHCGKEFTAKKRIYGNRQERLNWQEWASEHYDTCSECYAKICEENQIENAKRNGNDVIEVHYGEYKRNYANCETIKDSYNAKTKTILVIVPNYDAKVEIIEEELETVVEEIKAEVEAEVEVKEVANAKIAKLEKNLAFWINKSKEEKVKIIKIKEKRADNNCIQYFIDDMKRNMRLDVERITAEKLAAKKAEEPKLEVKEEVKETENPNNKYVKMVVETNAGFDALSYNAETQEVRYFDNGGDIELYDCAKQGKAREWLSLNFDDDSAGELYEDVEDVYEWLGVDGRNVKVLAEMEW